MPVFGTQSALKAAASNRGLPLRTGTYVLVPLAHADQMTADRLQAFELRQGLIVPKSTPAIELFNAAGTVMPNVTYATIEVVVRPAIVPCASRTTED